MVSGGTDAPMVRVVVLNYDGGEMTLDCLRTLQATEWPADRMELLLVDNGSVDGIASRVRNEMPGVRVLEPFANLGFAAGCNLGINAVGAYDHVALVNNDATVEPGWLAPLVEAIESGERVGAASSKMLIDGRFQEVTFHAPDARGLGRADRRRLGVRVTAVRLDGTRIDDRLAADEGFHAREAPDPRLGEEVALWSGRTGTLRIALDENDARPGADLQVRLVGFERRRVRITSGPASLDVIVDRTPRWFTIPLGPPVSVINNVGSCLFAGGYGGDRGFLEADRGQFDEPADVFAWCGGAVLLSRAYLADVGGFDERLFLYYEDTDLSWRGRLRGWSYTYVPGSVVHHRHAASSGGAGSPVFFFHTERNRLLVLLKNAPWPVTVRALAVQARIVAETVKADVVRPVLTLHRPHLRHLRPKLQALLGVARLAPAMLADRRRARPTLSRSDLMRWETTKETLA